MQPEPAEDIGPASGVWRRRLGLLGKIGVSAGALWILARQVDVGDFLEVLRGANPFSVAAVLAIYLIGQALTAYRWFFIAGKVGFGHGLGEITRYYFIGMFFNLFGPSTLGGDVVRSLYLCERDGRRMIAFNTVLFDRLSGLAMLVVLALLAMVFFGSFDLPFVIVSLTALAGIGMIVGWWLIPVATRLLCKPEGRVRQLVERDLGPFWRDRKLLLRAAWVSLSFHVLQVLSLILLGFAIGLDLDWRYYFVFHPLVTILSAAPVSLAGLGIREMGYVWFLERQEVGHDAALAFGLLWFGVLLAASLTGGLVYLASGSSMPRLRRKTPGGSAPSPAQHPEPGAESLTESLAEAGSPLPEAEGGA